MIGIDPLIEQAVIRAIEDIHGVELVLPLKRTGRLPKDGDVDSPYNLDPIVVTVSHYDETLHIAYDKVAIPTLELCESQTSSAVHKTNMGTYRHIPVKDIIETIPNIIRTAFSNKSARAKIAQRHGIDAPIPVLGEHERVTLRNYGHLLASRAVIDHIVSNHGLSHLVDMLDDILHSYWNNEDDASHPDIWESYIYIGIENGEYHSILDLTLKIGTLPALFDGKGLYIRDEIPEIIASQMKGEPFSRIIDAPGTIIPNLRIQRIQREPHRPLPWIPEHETERSTAIVHDAEWIYLKDISETLARHPSSEEPVLSRS